MEVIAPVKNGSGDVAQIPEFGASVVTARRHVILTVRIEIQIADGFGMMSVFNVINWRAFVRLAQVDHLQVRFHGDSQLVGAVVGRPVGRRHLIVCLD